MTAPPTNQVTMSLVLGGNLTDMEATTIAKALDLFSKLVKGLTPDGTPPTMAALNEGSAILGLSMPAATEQTILDGITWMTSHTTLPAGWDTNSVERLRDLAKLTTRPGVDSAKLHTTTTPNKVILDKAVLDAARAILDHQPHGYGSVTGELYAYTSTPKELSAKLRLDLDGSSVTIAFGDELDEQVRGWLRQTVTVHGHLTLHHETYAVTAVDAEEITLEEPAPTGALAPGLGIWSDLKDQGVTVADLMKAIRGDNWQETTYG